MSAQRVYLLLPTRGRPDELSASVESALDLAERSDRVFPLLFVDDDDPADYRSYRYVKSGPRWGYRNLHRYMNALSLWAREMDRAAGLEPGYQILWNDDEQMLTPGWDSKLLAYGDDPKVVFMRCDKTDPVDTAYPAWPGSLVDLLGRVSPYHLCDWWLAHVTAIADRLLLQNSTHTYAPDIFVRHNRSESDLTAVERGGDYSKPDEIQAEDYILDGYKLAHARGAGEPGWFWSPPFGCDPPGKPRLKP